MTEKSHINAPFAFIYPLYKNIFIRKQNIKITKTLSAISEKIVIFPGVKRIHLLFPFHLSCFSELVSYARFNCARLQSSSTEVVQKSCVTLTSWKSYYVHFRVTTIMTFMTNFSNPDLILLASDKLHLHQTNFI